MKLLSSFTIYAPPNYSTIPTVINGRIASEDEAIAHYQMTGEYLGMFDTPDQADAYAERLHRRQESYYNR